ncbi:HlyD family type I secretion periplasmic adaptor subunit [Vibrio agarivorans]|uniref:Membrane fusion protein (MFP) family protein n=1 Tax=Vibrio agarivorans TaxID=153622 RepID=A0ABT7Y520_9VIBR|nr:HlyD family type I secretion periplasmic adaptor subunit [Vibrio agarivorans]MDN2483144.1 HlyD family type I secretion periplasmic adaptor subunit [Vibrio agarivorans]
MSQQVAWSNYAHAQRSRKLVWIVAVLVVCIIGWASWAKLDEVIIGTGKVVPTDSVQTIQSLEGGIIRQISVVQGQTVEKGDPLVVLDNTRFKAAFEESQSQIDSLNAQQLQLRLELDSVLIDASQKRWEDQVQVDVLDFPLSAEPSQIELNAMDNYLARLAQLKVELEEAELRIVQQQQVLQDAQLNLRTQQNSVAIVKREMDMLEDVVASGAVAEVELLKLKRDMISLQGEISSTRTFIQKQQATLTESIADYRSLAQNFRSTARSEINEVESRLDQLGESQFAIKDQLNRTVMVAPVSGTIKEVFIRTQGGVAKPGEPILEIVPKNSNLIIETKINPRDIAFITNDLNAMVKFSAYDFVIYGGVEGKVVYVSADALQDEEGETFYRAHVELDPDNNTFDVIPGMQASVDILTGKKTVLQYWLKPVLRAKENALRER